MNDTETHYYEVGVSWSETRKGVLSSPVLNDKIQVATPPEFKGGIAGIWSPEHLLIAAVNSCLMTTFLAIAENSKLSYNNFSSKAIGKLEKKEGKFMMSEITLYPLVEVANQKDEDRALRILQRSEENCLISNSVKARIIFEPKVFVTKKQEET